MASFAQLTAQLNLNIQNFVDGLNAASTRANRFAANLNGRINTGMVRPADQATKSFKSVARVVQGILISQAFYTGLRSIKDATAAAWEFTNQLEQAKIAYTGLFGDVHLAQEFVNVLKDFAQTTPFAFKEAEGAARKLLGYGLDYSNLLFVIQAATNAAAFTGDASSIDAVANALGRIYQQGKLSTYELRTLTNAGIPAYQILADKLGLTAEQLRDINKLAIPAHVAINALVDGINERFNDVNHLAAYTFQGIYNSIKNSLLLISESVIKPVADGLKNVLIPVRDVLADLAKIAQTGGLGGLFEAIFPERLHAALRQFVVNIQILFDIIKNNLASVLQVIGAILEGIIMGINAVAPVFKILLGIISIVNQLLFQNATILRIISVIVAVVVARFLLIKAAALALLVVKSVVFVITKAFAGLIAVLNFIAVHPVWALLIGVGALVLGLTGGFGKLKDAIAGVFKGFDKALGYDPDDVLLPSQEDRAADLGKFNDRLKDTGDLMDDLADSTGKAVKAAKGLLSFDEVFKLNEPDEAGKGLTDLNINWDDFDWDIPDLDFDLDLGEIFPEITDIGTQNWVDSLIDYIIDLFGSREKALGTAIGALLGAALGYLIGGPLGALIGGVLGALAGYFWDDVARFLGLTDVGKIALPIATVLGAAIGWLVGGPLGALIGGGIGALIGWIIDRIAYGLETGDWSGIALPVGIGLGAGIGFLIGGPLGALVGAGIGALVGQVIEKIIQGFQTGDWDVGAIAWPIGTLIGAGIGAIIGGPVGALIGGAIGALVGWIVGLIVENWDAITEWFSNIWSAITTWCSNLWDTVKTWASNVWGTISGFFVDTWNALTGWISDTWNAFKGWASDTWNTISTWASDTWDTFSTWVSDTWNAFTTWVVDVKDAIVDWASNTWDSIKTWSSNTWDSIKTWTSNTWDSIKTWSGNTWDSIKTWSSNTWGTIKTWSGNAWGTIKEWSGNTWGSIKDWGSGVWGTFKESFSNFWTAVKEGCANLLGTFTSWISDIWNNVFNKLFGWIGDAISKLKEFFGLNSKADAQRNSVDSLDAQSMSAGFGVNLPGHATGGIFNKEHIARFSEGNKAEAIIPLENVNAMRPFVDMISDGIIQGLAPTMVSGGNEDAMLQPLYVGTLIADERGLKELNRKMQVIQLAENKRRGR